MLAQNGCLKIRNLKRSNQQKLFRIIIILKLPILFEKLFQHFSNFQSASHNVLYLSIRHSLKKDYFRFKASKKSALFEITELRSQLEPLYSRSFYLKRIKPPPPLHFLPFFFIQCEWCLSSKFLSFILSVGIPQGTKTCFESKVFILAIYSTV